MAVKGRWESLPDQPIAHTWASRACVAAFEITKTTDQHRLGVEGLLVLPTDVVVKDLDRA